jgi:hypothetical protein
LCSVDPINAKTSLKNNIYTDFDVRKIERYVPWTNFLLIEGEERSQKAVEGPVLPVLPCPTKLQRSEVGSFVEGPCPA